MRTDTTLAGALIYQDNSEGYITKLISEGGTLFSDANRFAVGCMLTDGQTGIVYYNRGTVASPSWTSITDIVDVNLDLADGKVFVGSSAGKAVAVDFSGDVTIANTGAVTIGAGVVETTMIADNNITTDKILDANVTNAKLGGPKLGMVQETVAVADFDDSAASAIGFIDFTSTIPAGAIVTQSMISALTGFAGDTTATIEIGDGTTANRYSTGTPSVFATAAFVSAGAVSGTAYNLTAVTPRVTITGSSDFTSIVTDGNGEVTITIFYYTV